MSTTKARQLHDGEQIVHHLLGRLGLKDLAQPQEPQQREPPLPLLVFTTAITRHSLTTTASTI
jgi:hypothetical protein